MNLIGHTFDSFTVLRELASGARTRVFLVSDGLQVKALKVFPLEYLVRAERELRLAGGLDHPHLNRVEALTEVADYPSVTMPYVAGDRLNVWLGRAGRTEFLATFRGVLSALSYLHAQGVVHRDVKPENILVDRHGHARLVDFDLAVRVDEPQRPGAAAGTVAYLSPEEARGERAVPASDLYAAGIILYRGLTGEVPFTGSVSEVVAAHAATTPRPPSEFDPHLDRFDAFFATLLAKRPEDRFASATAVMEALGNVTRRLENVVPKNSLES